MVATMRNERTFVWAKTEPHTGWGSGRWTSIATRGAGAGPLEIRPADDGFAFWGGWSHSWNNSRGRWIHQCSAGLVGQFWLRRYRMPDWDAATSAPVARLDGPVTGKTGGRFKGRPWRPSPTAIASVWGRQRVFAGPFGDPQRDVAATDLTGRHAMDLVGDFLFFETNGEEVFDRTETFHFEPVTFELDRSRDLLIELDFRVRISLRGNAAIHMGTGHRDGETWTDTRDRADRTFRIRLPEWNLQEAFTVTGELTQEPPTIEL
ncbi:hypothetical protein VB773_22310 [Haloarculaceae archaeon H-GB2-1]|nr:hypothetical protein [Haloarculaceae archaeon H-GB1-1]MEA5389512.1 hypothetical protein [Haloarculaceae archaeon H-GB11]MEA5410034.1 hypothetical protein [Haloarculaceae archaeon H-GB2-1]